METQTHETTPILLAVRSFLEREYQVVATACRMEQFGFQTSKQFALVDGDIGEASTAKNV